MFNNIASFFQNLLRALSPLAIKPIRKSVILQSVQLLFLVISFEECKKVIRLTFLVQLPSIYFCPKASVQWHIEHTCVTVVPRNFSQKRFASGTNVHLELVNAVFTPFIMCKVSLFASFVNITVCKTGDKKWVAFNTFHMHLLLALTANTLF